MPSPRGARKPAVYPKHAEMVAYLQHCLVVHEVPDGSNRGPVQIHRPDGGVDVFQAHDFVAGVGYAWCVCTWLAGLDYAGLKWPYRSPGAYAQGNYARKHGLARPVTELIPGDGCVWQIGAGHLSTFLSYDPRREMVKTIDGNVSNRMGLRERHVSLLHTGIHVPEDPKLLPPKEPKPFWVIATSENGHRQLLFTKFATEKMILNKILPPLVKRYGKAGVTITKGGVRKPK